MGNVNVAITVPSANGSGASADVSSLSPEKTFVYAGTLVGSVTVEISNDGTNWGPLITLTGPQEVTLTAVATYVRATVAGYIQGTGALSVGGESTSANLFSSVNVPASTGNGTALDVSTYGPLKTFIWGGADRAFDGTLTIMVSQDGTNYGPLFTLGSLSGIFTTSAPCDYVRILRSGPTNGTAPSISVGAFNADTSGGSGFVPMGGPNLSGLSVRSGRGVYVNPADPNAADDSNWQTPKLTITGAIAAIVAAGPPTSVATSLTRWAVFVAPGCYDEDVTVPAEIPHLVMIAMGGVTLGDGISSYRGSSTTARDFTWEVNNDYKFVNDGSGNPQPPSRLVLATMNPNNAAYDLSDYYLEPSAPGTEVTSEGWRISGEFVVTDSATGTPYEDNLFIYLNSVFVEGDCYTDVSNAAYPWWTFENCSLYQSFTNTANGTISYAHLTVFATKNIFGGAHNFTAGTTRTFDHCKFYSQTTDLGACSASLLTDCLFVSGSITSLLWTGTLQVDANTLFSLGALGRTVVAYANTGDLICVDTPSVAVFGNTDIGAGAGDVFLDPGFQNAAAGAADDKQIPAVPSAGSGNETLIIQGISVRHNLAAGNGASVTYEVLINGASAATPITVSLATNAVGQGHSSAKPAFGSAAARLSVRATKPGGGIGSGVQNAIVAVRYYMRTQG